MNSNSLRIGFRGLGSALPARFTALADLPLKSEPEALTAAGFTGAYVAEDVHDLALSAASNALADAGVTGANVDHLIWTSALPKAHHRRSEAPAGGVLDEFGYSASWLQDTLRLDRASVCGIAQQGCAGMFSALRTAHALLHTEPGLEHILCVGVDVLPGGCREILYNVISDAACAVVVSRKKTRYRWLGYHQISRGYYWDVPAKQSEIIAAYFPTSRQAILGVLQATGLKPDEIDLVIPTGVNESSWPILLRLCGIPEERLYRPESRFGHTVAADSILFLEEAWRRGALHAGMRVLLFTYGFGSSWCALVLEVGEEGGL